MFFYHLCHVLSDRFGSLHGVDGDSARLFYTELTSEALLERRLSEVHTGIAVVFPL